jgi:hypothetical protein
MKKHLLAALLWPLACGAYDPEELGTESEALTARSSSNFGYGVNQTAFVNDACVRDSREAGQFCMVPISKSHTYCLDGSTPFSPAEAQNITDTMQTIRSGLTGFTWTEVNHADINCAADVQIRRGTCPGTCSSGGTIQNCVCTTVMRQGSTISESEAGNYVQMLGSVITLDRADIDAHYAVGSTTWHNVEVHGLGHNLLFLDGLGGKPANAGTNDALISGRRIDPALTGHGAISAGEQCKAINYDVSSPSTFTYSSTCSD